MKRIFTIISLALLAFGLSSCMSQLDIPQKSVSDLDTYYANAGPAEAEALISSVYKSYYADVHAANCTIFLDVLSDDHFVGGGSEGDTADNHYLANTFNYDSSRSNVNNKFVALYRVIYFCNLIIEKIPETTDATINRVKTEARFFRALSMFDALRWWGNPPLVNKLPVSAADRQPSNSTPKEVYDWVISEFAAIADQLPAISAKGAQKQFGARVSKHTVLAYMGKASVFYGTKYNDNAAINAAIEPLKTVINSGLYGLIDNIDDLDSHISDFCSENIFEFNAADADGYPANQSNNIQLWKSWSMQFIKAFPVGIATVGWNFACPTGDFGDFLKEHEGGVDKPRFKAILRTYDQLLAMEYPDNIIEKGVQPLHDCQGYFRYYDLLRYDELLPDVGDSWYTKYNLPYLRYSEVLLYYAEAQFLANNDADGTGLKALNEVRERAELAPLASMTYQDIKDERRAELWGRQERFFDLVRWGDAKDALKDKAKKRYTFYGYKEGTTEWDIQSKDYIGNGWQDKYEVLPYPLAQLNANPNLTQNPGW